MKIELEINKQDFLEIIKYYYKGYQKDLNTFNLFNLLDNQLIEEYFETIGTCKVLNKKEIIDIIKKEIKIIDNNFQ